MGGWLYRWQNPVGATIQMGSAGEYQIGEIVFDLGRKVGLK